MQDAKLPLVRPATTNGHSQQKKSFLAFEMMRGADPEAERLLNGHNASSGTRAGHVHGHGHGTDGEKCGMPRTRMHRCTIEALEDDS
jgi:hypothetical protein